MHKPDAPQTHSEIPLAVTALETPQEAVPTPLVIQHGEITAVIPREDQQTPLEILLTETTTARPTEAQLTASEIRPSVEMMEQQFVAALIRLEILLGGTATAAPLAAPLIPLEIQTADEST